MRIEVMINNKKIEMEVANDEFLVDALRRYGYSSVKRGCDTGCCGLCTVWINNRPTLSCSTLAPTVNGKAITTIEGIQKEAKDFAEFLVKEGAEQCGFCSPGFIMTVLAMKKELEQPTEEEILHYLAGNLCRCTGYAGQLRAIKKYLEV
ncbi:MAG: (2Fe-2S)-binding protein [Bacillota bacterium]